MAETTPEIKVVNATQLDADLTSVCNKIRESAPTEFATSEKFSFPIGVENAINVVATSRYENGKKDGWTPVVDGTIEKITSNAEILRDTALGYCSSLTIAKLPNVLAARRYAFRDCTALKLVDFGSNQTTSLNVAGNVFSGASALETVIIRYNFVATLVATNAFNGTPIASGGGGIYVPASLVDEYKSASNWSSFADQIFAIEDYPEITGGAV